MKNKLKCYVLIVSTKFPAYHPRKGENTGFVDMIMNGKKIHTIRGNYELWKKRINEVNEGKAYISLRYWSDQPYKSKQVEFLKLYQSDYQKYEHDRDGVISVGEYYLGWKDLMEDTLANNDGLTWLDFYEWFKMYKGKPFYGIIIHFTDFRY